MFWGEFITLLATETLILLNIFCKEMMYFKRGCISNFNLHSLKLESAFLFTLYVLFKSKIAIASDLKLLLK